MTAFDVTDPRGRVLHKHIMQALVTAVVVMQASVLACYNQATSHPKPYFLQVQALYESFP
jgi:hypothetical protein